MVGLACGLSSATININATDLSHHSRACWKHTDQRGGGVVPSSCDPAFDKSGLLCYPECKEGFHGVGPVCWSKCPIYFTSKGIFCLDHEGKPHLKKSYGRGVGTYLKCHSSQVRDPLLLGLCYDKCKCTQRGVGPVCWDSCGGKYPVEGGAMCCTDKEFCKEKLKGMGFRLPLSVAKAVLDSDNAVKEIEDVKHIVEELLGFVLPLCPQVY